MISKLLYRLRFAFLFIVLIGTYTFVLKDIVLGYHCPFYEATGLSCPGCGGLRAVNSLLKADFNSAFNYNPLVVIVILLLPFLLNGWIRKNIAKYEFIKIRFPVIALILVIAFGVIRNI